MAIVNIPRRLIPSIEWLSSNGELEDNFPCEGCSRREQELDISDIFSSFGYPLEECLLDDTSIQFVDMNISGEHVIFSHIDGTHLTLILYLHKDETIEDQFWVEDKKIEGRWEYDPDNYKGLLFEGNLIHDGILRGVGKRQLLVFFVNKNTEVFDIPKTLLPSIEELDKVSEHIIERSYWGEETNMAHLEDFFVEEDVWQLFSESLICSNITIEDFQCQYIKYNIDGEYVIEKHMDNVYATLIIYLEKDRNIEDEFWVNDKKIEGRWKNNDNYQALFMIGYQPHNGILRGNGERKVLVFFFNKKED